MVPGKPFPKLGLPLKQRPLVVRGAPKVPSELVPAQDQPYASTIYDIAMQEMDRAGKGAANAAVLEAMMSRIVGDDALFRRITTQIMRKECIRRIKKIRRRWAAEGQMKK